MPDTSSVTSQISYFKSSLDTQLLDMLWHKYWVNTLASSPLITTRDLATGQITDICALLCEQEPPPTADETCCSLNFILVYPACPMPELSSTEEFAPCPQERTLSTCVPCSCSREAGGLRGVSVARRPHGTVQHAIR